MLIIDQIKMNQLNPSIKAHLWVGAFLSFWVFSFAFFIRPFDRGIYFYDWHKISISYSLVAFLVYGLVAVIQKLIYQKYLKWHIGFEVFIVLLFHLLYLIVAYGHYKSPIYNGIATFTEFSNRILKSMLFTAPILVLARIYLSRYIPKKADKITIKGENKLDVLRLDKADLVYVTNAQNYVEIFFVSNGEFSSRLIRSSLKKILKDLSFLVQVHRSYLINPMHFQSWKNQNTISLTQIDIPVSKNYKHNLLTHDFHP